MRRRETSLRVTEFLLKSIEEIRKIIQEKF